ncbi:MAG: hypothetical protein KAI33_01770 [Elusimicrobiales bacterium]|nr:hypothetical protein [Elusimicrobiales bacterium]
MKTNKFILKIYPNRDFIKPAVSFIVSSAQEFCVFSKKRKAFEKSVYSAISLAMECLLVGGGDEPVLINVFELESKLNIEIINRGVPVLFSGDKFECGIVEKSYLSDFYESSKDMDEVLIKNFCRDGQAIILKVSPDSKGAGNSADKTSAKKIVLRDKDISIRSLKAGEGINLSQLFYFVYGYKYIHESIYYPERIKKMIESGDLISVAAVMPDGRLAGHVGLVKWGASPPVFEAALGLVDPAFKSKGLFKDMFAAIIEKIKTTSMQYCFFDFVTNHDLSQKFISKFGTCDMSILVGCQSKLNQARLEKIGLGPDPEKMDRYSLLFSIIPRVKYPFGKTVSLPASIGESMEFLLKPLNLEWTPSSRFESLPDKGDYKADYDAAQSSVIFDLFDPGREAIESILEEWRSALKNGFQYAGIDIPVAKPGLGGLYDILSGNKFFVAGFVPHRFSDKLCFRFQAIGYTEVAFDKIKIFSDTGKRLFEIIKKDYERNCQI